MAITSDKRWTIKAADDGDVAQLQEALGIHKALCRLLVVRGIANYDAAKHFFRPQITDLHDPFLMKGMQAAVTRITQAIESNEPILVYGDYDVDGTTSVSVMYSFLRSQYKGELNYYIPHRYREGYGISKMGIDYAHEQGYTLMITLDCGIKSVELIAYAKSLGIDVIVCDHHTPDEQLPPAYAILNPKQKDCNYPYKELSGCGIGFKLICALAEKWNLGNDTTHRYLDLVATSIAADIVPIDGENRVLAFYGLKQANTNPSKGIKVLKELADVKKDLTISDMVFVIGPRVNAAGRMDDAKKAVELFVEEDITKVPELAEALHLDNTDRKEIDKNTTEEALQMLQDDELTSQFKTTVLFKKDWHKGVVGIVASRLIDHYYRPTIILTESNGKVTGSARSVRDFNVYDAIDKCGDLLENYGGHFYAAGLTMLPENLMSFKEKFESVVASTITPDLLVPEIEIDAEIRISDIKQPFYNIMKQFEPFGPTNLRPVFVSRFVFDYQGNTRVVKEQHIRFVIHQHDGVIIDGIGFGLANKYHVTQKPFDIVYTIDENEYNGRVSLQMKVIDIRPAQ